MLLLSNCRKLSIVRDLINRLLNKGDIVLLSGEIILFGTQQGRLSLSNSFFSPDLIVATNQRLTFIESMNMGISKKVNEIPYSYVTDSKWEDGRIFSTLYVKIPGRSFQKRSEKKIVGSSKFQNDQQWVKIEGLQPSHARKLHDIIRPYYSSINPSVKIITGDNNKPVKIINTSRDGQDNFTFNP